MVNGKLQYKTTTGGGLDADGNPIKAVETWSDPIDCLISRNGNGRMLKYQDGAQVVAEYSVSFDFQNFTYDHIRITDNREQILGEYQVLQLNVHHYTLFPGRVKIIV